LPAEYHGKRVLQRLGEGGRWIGLLSSIGAGGTYKMVKHDVLFERRAGDAAAGGDSGAAGWERDRRRGLELCGVGAMRTRMRGAC